MQKQTSFSRSVLGGRPTEKENSFINSNTSGLDVKTYNLLKYKKQSSHIATHTENIINDTSFHDITIQKLNKQPAKNAIQSSENMKLSFLDKSQEIFAKDFKKSGIADRLKRNNDKGEKKFAKPTTTILNRENSKVSSNNLSFINNVPTTKPTNTINYYDNFIRKTKNEPQNVVHKEERNYSISNLFPSILENLNLCSSSTSTSDVRSLNVEVENRKLAKYYAKDIMEVLINKDVKIIVF